MKKLLLTLISATFAMTTNAQPQLRADNIDEVLKAMTLEEKAQILRSSRHHCRDSTSRHPRHCAHRRPCRRPHRPHQEERHQHLLCYGLPRRHLSGLHLEHRTRRGRRQGNRQRDPRVWLRCHPRPWPQHPPQSPLRP